MRKCMTLLAIGLTLSSYSYAQEQKKRKRVFVTDTTSYLVPSKTFSDKGWFFFTDAYLKQLYTVKVKVDTVSFPDNSIELVQHIWNTDFYKNILVRKPQRGFLKHFENTEIYLKEQDTIYRLYGSAFEY